MKKETIENILHTLAQGTVQVVPESELYKKLEQGKKLKVKFGIDPTSSDLHLGHAVVLSKLKQFQDLGHEIILLIGDFTARIGDPSGRSRTRPPLTDQHIKENMRTYFAQAGKILDMKKALVRYNSEWCASLTAAHIIELCSQVTVARIIEREDFANRLSAQQPIGMHELLYPIFQGYDSVMLHADVELGGTDQTFNLLMGRFLQEQIGQEAQVIITTPLLEGLDGVQKMSKSFNNAISLTESADNAYGKIMSISDTLMWRYAQLLLHKPSSEISQLQERIAGGTLHPMVLKKELARNIIARFWSPAEAEEAQNTFEALFQQNDYSHAQEVVLPEHYDNPVWIVELLKTLGAVTTSSEAKRLIENGAVLIDEQLITDFKASISWQTGMIIKVGKYRFYKIKERIEG